MSRAAVIGVMGPGASAKAEDLVIAATLGKEIALRGWVTLCGGRNTGVMEAVSSAARIEGGLTIGLLPDSDLENVASGILLALPTDLGNARNNLNVLACDLVIAIAISPGAGTLSEICLAAKNKKPLLVVTCDDSLKKVLERVCGKAVHFARNGDEAVAALTQLMTQSWNEDQETRVRLQLGVDRNSGS